MAEGEISRTDTRARGEPDKESCYRARSIATNQKTDRRLPRRLQIGIVKFRGLETSHHSSFQTLGFSSSGPFWWWRLDPDGRKFLADTYLVQTDPSAPWYQTSCDLYLDSNVSSLHLKQDLSLLSSKKKWQTKEDNDKKQLFKATHSVDSIGLNLKKT